MLLILLLIASLRGPVVRKWEERKKTKTKVCFFKKSCNLLWHKISSESFGRLT